MAGIFKAYDIRGTYPDQLNEQIAEDVGRAFEALLASAQPDSRGEVVVSRDMRPHSVPLQQAVIRGLRAAGVDVVDIGLASTPMSYFAVGRLGAAGGIQVTASHNPAQYNGLKFSLAEARPVSGDDGIPLLERLVEAGELPTGERKGALRETEIADPYAEHLLGLLRRPEGARRLRVVADAANGMGTLYRPFLERAGIELIPLYFELDGSFPNHEANPLKLENLADLRAAVVEHGADLGVSFDGDADRAAFVDEQGEPIGSDLMTALIGGDKLASHPGGVVVYDVRSSRAVAEYLVERGGVPVRERVGHSFIKATMRQRDALFGGELAGHYYFRENYYADCSLLAVFDTLSILWEAGAPMSEVIAPLRRYAKSEEINFEVDDKAAAMAGLESRYGDGEIDRIDGIRIDFADWWFNVRPSNTEPLLRLVLEARTPELLAEKQAELVGMLGEPV